MSDFNEDEHSLQWTGSWPFKPPSQPVCPIPDPSVPEPSGDFIKDELGKIQAFIDGTWAKKRQRLVDMDFFCLDNSIRESTVGQLRSHTLADKIGIFEEVKKAGMTDIMVSSFSHMTRVDDDFVKYLIEKGEDFSKFFSFAEISNKGVVDGVYESELMPTALGKNAEYGIYNNFFEVDFADAACDWGGKYTVEMYCQLIKKRIDFVYDKIKRPDNIKPRMLVNIRDFPVAMRDAPERVLEVVKFLSQLPKERNLFALAFEDPLGEYLPEQLEAWVASVRRTMDHYGWTDAKFLVHIHQKWDLQTASVLDVLGAGCDGVWASMCEEGAALGHACSVTTMMNLIRLGNKKILKKYNCTYFRKAAINVTKLTTGNEPHPKVPVYGARSMDLVFGFLGVGDFDIAEFFGIEAPNRITSLASTSMLIERLTKHFGPNPQFNEDIAKNMQKQMLEDLRNEIKEDYHSLPGLAILFDRSGGKLTDEMADVLAKMELTAVHHDNLIAEVKKEWDKWDQREEPDKQGDDALEFDSFYHGFMAPYFGCYRCTRTKKGLSALDMNKDGNIDWKEFLVFIKWALRQYPETEDYKVLMQIVFEKGLIPAMKDEQVKKTKNKEKAAH